MKTLRKILRDDFLMSVIMFTLFLVMTIYLFLFGEPCYVLRELNGIEVIIRNVIDQIIGPSAFLYVTYLVCICKKIGFLIIFWLGLLFTFHVIRVNVA
jgi:hypothetical protein